MSTSFIPLWENWLDSYFMRKKLPKMKWEDIYVTLFHEDAIVEFYNSGLLKIKGNVKCAAIAFAKHILETTAGRGSMNYIYIKIHIKDKYSIEWLNSVKLSDGDVFNPEPAYWEEFKREFERYCELKAFL